MSSNFNLLSNFNLIYFMNSQLINFEKNYIINKLNLKNLYINSLNLTTYSYKLVSENIPLRLNSVRSLNNKFRIKNHV